MKKLFNYLNKKKVEVSVWAMLLLMNNVAFASGVGGSTAEQKFDNVIEFIAGWVGKIGMVVAFIGAIQFALAFRNDDAEGKTKGIQFFVSGLIALAVVGAKSMFFS